MNHIEYEKGLTEGAVNLHGKDQALADKLISDLDSGSITEIFADIFMQLYKAREGVDLVDLM